MINTEKSQQSNQDSILWIMNLILYNDLSLENHCKGIDSKAKHLLQLGHLVKHLKVKGTEAKKYILQFIIDASKCNLDCSRTQRIYNCAYKVADNISINYNKLYNYYNHEAKLHHWNSEAIFHTHLGISEQKFMSCDDIARTLVNEDFNLFNFRSELTDPDYNNQVNEIKYDKSLLKNYIKHYKPNNKLEKQLKFDVQKLAKTISNINLKHNSLQNRYNRVYNDSVIAGKSSIYL